VPPVLQVGDLVYLRHSHPWPSNTKMERSI
jgi:hypothetical protein